MDMIVGLRPGAGEAEPSGPIPGISDRTRAEAERRTVGRRAAAPDSRGRDAAAHGTQAGGWSTHPAHRAPRS